MISTLALFLALGGGLAWALATDSVRSKHIKDGQVKPADLNDALEPHGFSYTASTGDNVQEEVLNVRGYAVTAACDDVGGLRELELFLEFPQDGTIQGFAVSDDSDDAAVPSAGSGSSVTGGDAFGVGALPAPSADEFAVLASYFSYTGQTEAATLNLNMVADDEDQICRLNGVLSPGIIPAA